MTTAHAVQRRPKDRKAHIAAAAAEAFGVRGYHAASMESIAASVGISAAALYRHYANKYDLFRGAVLAFGQQLVDVSAGPELASTDPAVVLERLLGALIDATLRNRDAGGLYRWQARYLDGADQRVVMEQMRAVNHRIQQPLQGIRPTLSSRERWLLACGVLSVIGSVLDHQVSMPACDIRALLSDAASTVLASEVPRSRDAGPVPQSPAIFTPRAGGYHEVLFTAMMLFGERGYSNTSMAQIAAGVGIPVSGIYRYFSGKREILAAGLRRTVDWAAGELARVSDREPRRALVLLIDTHVAMAFANPEVEAIYNTEWVNLDPADQAVLGDLRRATIDTWVRLLISVRPELAANSARFLVHAALALVVDLRRLLRFDEAANGSGCPQESVRMLVRLILFGAGAR